MLYISNMTGYVDGFVQELTFANRFYKHFLSDKPEQAMRAATEEKRHLQQQWNPIRCHLHMEASSGPLTLFFWCV